MTWMIESHIISDLYKKHDWYLFHIINVGDVMYSTCWYIVGVHPGWLIYMSATLLRHSKWPRWAAKAQNQCRLLKQTLMGSNAFFASLIKSLQLPSFLPPSISFHFLLYICLTPVTLPFLALLLPITRSFIYPIPKTSHCPSLCRPPLLVASPHPLISLIISSPFLCLRLALCVHTGILAPGPPPLTVPLGRS